MPNIASSMPYYINSEQEFVFRAFHTGSYDLLRHLPQDLKTAQVGALQVLRRQVHAAQGVQWGCQPGPARLPLACASS